jgi:hypothetical protein
VTPDAGLPADLFGLGLAIGDLNADGRSDIFVSHSNRLFISTKQGGYTEPAGPKATFAWKPLDREDWPAGAVFADLNRDARLDLIVGIHHERARNRVYLNEGVDGDVPRFRDVSSDAGLPPQLTTKSPHVEAQDFDTTAGSICIFLPRGSTVPATSHQWCFAMRACNEGSRNLTHHGRARPLDVRFTSLRDRQATMTATAESICFWPTGSAGITLGF